MIVTIIILAVAFTWLLVETRQLTIRLIIYTQSKPNNIAIPKFEGFMSMIFSVLGIVLFTCLFSEIPKHKPFPVILVSPSGKYYTDFNLNQAKHICKRVFGWSYVLTTVKLKSPSHKEYIFSNAVKEERICRKHDMWDWE